MQKYHYTDGTNTFGPFSIDELKYKGITGDTLVWTEGMPNWVLARQVPELVSIIQESDRPYFTADSQPPPAQFPNSGAAPLYGQSSGRPPKTYLLEAILTTIFCCWALGIPSIVYASRVERKFYAGDFLGAEQDSANAKKWMWINVGACIVLYFIIFVFGIFGAMFGDITDF